MDIAPTIMNPALAGGKPSAQVTALLEAVKACQVNHLPSSKVLVSILVAALFSALGKPNEGRDGGWLLAVAVFAVGVIHVVVTHVGCRLPLVPRLFDSPPAVRGRGRPSRALGTSHGQGKWQTYLQSFLFPAQSVPCRALELVEPQTGARLQAVAVNSYPSYVYSNISGSCSFQR